MYKTKKELDAYYFGLEVGIRRYAHWHNGEQYVGTTGQTLRGALDNLARSYQADLESLNKDTNHGNS